MILPWNLKQLSFGISNNPPLGIQIILPLRSQTNDASLGSQMHSNDSSLESQTIVLWEFKLSSLWDVKRTMLPWDLKCTQTILPWNLKWTQWSSLGISNSHILNELKQFFLEISIELKRSSLGISNKLRWSFIGILNKLKWSSSGPQMIHQGMTQT